MLPNKKNENKLVVERDIEYNLKIKLFEEKLYEI